MDVAGNSNRVGDETQRSLGRRSTGLGSTSRIRNLQNGRPEVPRPRPQLRRRIRGTVRKWAVLEVEAAFLFQLRPAIPERIIDPLRNILDPFTETKRDTYTRFSVPLSPISDVQNDYSE